MPSKIFVNLPVRDVARSRAFFSALGFGFDEKFSNEQGACLVVDAGHSYAMLLAEPFFAGFTSKRVADARESTEVLVALELASRAEVDAMAAKAVAAGGREARPVKDHGFMFERAFEDPDGHVWEVFWMDPSGPPPSA